MEDPIDSFFTPDKIEFVSVRKGLVGSIYFQDGRIRLIHKYGPKIEIPDSGSIKRYTVLDKDWKKYKKWRYCIGRNCLPDEIYQHISNELSSFKEFTLGEGDKLLEFYKKDGKMKFHPSRGRPEKIQYQLNQRQINIIYNIANINKNEILLHEMDVDPTLRKLKKLLREP